MPFGFPAAPAAEALSADAIKVPKGHPGRILSASRKLRATAARLDAASTSCADAGVTAVEAEGWTGPAALAFAATTYVLSSAMVDGERSLRRAAAACRNFADELEKQQDVARAARRAGQAAERRANAAATKLRAAVADKATAKSQADTAATDEGVEVRRPVRAERLEGDVYRIADQPYERDEESWEFEPGDAVHCEPMPSSEGAILAAPRRAG